MKLTAEQQDTLHRLLEAPTDDFSHLVKIVGLDPASDFRYADLREIQFGRADLKGYDFTGPDLRGSDLRSASTDGAVWTKANTKDCLWPSGKEPG